MTVRVSYAAYIGATTAVAKKDVRNYLNGVFIDPKGFLVATDGHRLFCSVLEEGHGPHIVKIEGKAPSRFDHAVFLLNDGRVCFCGQDGQELASLRIDLINERYPDWERAADGFPVAATEVIGLDLAYMADAAKIAKAYGTSGAKFEFHGSDRAVKIYFKGEDAWMSIMPCRV